MAGETWRANKPLAAPISHYHDFLWLPKSYQRNLEMLIFGYKSQKSITELYSLEDIKIIFYWIPDIEKYMKSSSY